MTHYTCVLFHNSASLPMCDEWMLDSDPRPFLGEPLWVAGSVWCYNAGGEVRLLVSEDIKCD